jgi:hypothetical protein
MKVVQPDSRASPLRLIKLAFMIQCKVLYLEQIFNSNNFNLSPIWHQLSNLRNFKAKN